MKLFVLSSSSSLKGNRGRIAPSVRLSLTAKAVVLFSLTVVSTPIVFCSGWWTLDSGQHYTILYGPSRSLDGDGDDNNDGDDDDDDVLFFSTEKRVVSLTRPVVFSLSPSPFANNRLRLASRSRLLDDSGTAEKRKELYRRRRRRGKGKKKKKKTAAAMHRSRKKKKTHIRQSLWHKRFRLTDTLEGAAAAAGCSLAHSHMQTHTALFRPAASPLLSSPLVSSPRIPLAFTLLYSTPPPQSDTDKNTDTRPWHLFFVPFPFPTSAIIIRNYYSLGDRPTCKSNTLQSAPLGVCSR